MANEETNALKSLATAYTSLDFDTNHMQGSEAWDTFLQALENAVTAFKVVRSSRDYRQNFTVNYKPLFPTHGLNYRVDVLVACLENTEMVWVNGEKFDLSIESLSRGDRLRERWLALDCELSRASRDLSCDCNEFQQILTRFDWAWAAYESSYIDELIAIESKARQSVLEAIALDTQLLEFERHCSSLGSRAILQDNPQYRQIQTRLVNCIARMNSVANDRRRGRDDLGEGILAAAWSELSAHNGRAATVLASNVVDSFESLRTYFRSVATCLERVDPHLSGNSKLVDSLVAWEDKWESGSRYLLEPSLPEAISDLVATTKALYDRYPEFKAMVEDYSAELFLVLPRMTWIWFLAAPSSRALLLRTVLPHRIAADLSFDSGLQSLLRRVEDAYAGVEDVEDYDELWHCFMTRSILGPGMCGEDESTHSVTQRTVSGLTHELEAWSLELQRHSPDDWNQFAQVLLKCLGALMEGSSN